MNMILFFLFSCSETLTEPLPEKRRLSPVLSQRVQYGELKGHLFSKGSTASEGYVTVERAQRTHKCIEENIKENQTILVIESLKSKDMALNYLKQHIDGQIKIIDTNSLCQGAP